METRRVASNFLNGFVFGPTGKLGRLASIDCDGHCVIEYNDETQDVTHYSNIPTISDWLVCQENNRVFVTIKVVDKTSEALRRLEHAAIQARFAESLSEAMYIIQDRAKFKRS